MGARKTNRTGSAAAVLLVFTVVLTIAVMPAGAQQVDYVKENGLVIDDMYYRYADNVQFYANPEKTAPANPGDFREGSRIGYELDQDGKISAVWLR